MSKAAETAKLNGELKKTETGYEYTVTVSEEHTNSHGTIHGGILYMICCEAAAMVSETCGRPCVGMDGSIQYYKAAYAGEQLNAEVTLKKDGRKVSAYEVGLYNQRGKLLCDCLFKNMYLD